MLKGLSAGRGPVDALYDLYYLGLGWGCFGTVSLVYVTLI